MGQRPADETSGAGDVGDRLFAWLFTAIGIVMLVRLTIVAFRAAAVAMGWLSEGNVLERISIHPFDLSPTGLAINLVVPAIVLTLFAISRLSASDETDEADGQGTATTDDSP